MAIYKGNKKVVAVYKGSTPINKIYKGGTLVFQTGGGSQSVPVIITFTNDSDPANRQYTPVCEGTTKTATSQTIELPSEGETYKFGEPWEDYIISLLEVRNYSNNCPSVTSFESLFANATNMKTLTFAKGIDTSKIESMSGMFDSCISLTSLDLSSFDVTNLTDANSMFQSCYSLTSLILPDFSKSSSLSNVMWLFRDCRSLVSLDLTKVNTSNCTSLSSMFEGCRSLTSLDLSNFNTSNTTECSGMFSECSSLKNVNLSSFDTSNTTHVYAMFNGCSSLESLDLSSFNTSKFSSAGSMFNNCTSLASLDLSNFNITSSSAYVNDMFNGCNKLTHIKCKQAFKNWCITKQDTIKLPTAMREGGSGTWEIVG